MIVLVGLLARAAFLSFAFHREAFEWIDGDGYVTHAQMLVSDEGWRWTPAAVAYFEFTKAPLYVVFLSLFAAARPLRLTVAVAQVLLSALTTLGAFGAACTLHSRRAGLVAALLAALWFPGIVSGNTFLQEHLYIPLFVGGLCLLVRVVAADAAPSRFAAAGAVLGMAALARSMPLYMVVPLGLVHAGSAPSRRRGTGQALALLAGFLAVALPYSVFISSQLGRVIPIEDVGTFQFARDARDEVAGTSRPLSGGEVLGLLERRLVASPAHHVDMLLNMAKLKSGSWIEAHGRVDTAREARALELLAHVLGDLPFALTLVLAPIGLAVARQRRAAGLVGLTLMLHVLLVVLAGYSGARFRGPIEPVIAILAACAMAGGWNRPPRWAGTAAAVAALALATVVLASAPLSLEGRADYGLRPWSGGPAKRWTRAGSEAGFAVRPTTGVLDIEFVPTAPPSGRGRLRVLLDGRLEDQIDLTGASSLRRRYSVPAGRLTYVELRGTGPALEVIEHRSSVTGP